MWAVVVVLTTISWSMLVQARCNMGDAKWKGPPVVTQPSKAEPGKVLVDWNESIKNPSCVDEYYVWVWKQGQDKKTQGRKFTISDYKVTSKLVDIEPCVFYNFVVELYEKDWINKHTRESEVVTYNSAALPSFNSSNVLKYFSVGYLKDPRTGGFDVEKASIKFQTAFKGSVTTPDESGVGGKGWEAFGTGRQPGENG